MDTVEAVFKDVKALLEYSKIVDSNSLILDSVIKSNDLQPYFVEEVIKANVDLKTRKKLWYWVQALSQKLTI